MTNGFPEIISIDISDIIFHFNKNYQAPSIEGATYTDFSLEITPNILQSNENQFDGLIILKVQMFDEDFEEKNNPFYLEMEVLGRFNTEKTGEPFHKNALQALHVTVPYIRTYISAITALSSFETVSIPIVNINQVIGSHSTEE